MMNAPQLTLAAPGVTAADGERHAACDAFMLAIEEARISDLGDAVLTACRIAFNDSPVNRFIVVTVEGVLQPRAVLWHGYVRFADYSLIVGEVVVIAEPLPLSGWLRHDFGVYKRTTGRDRWTKIGGTQTKNAAVASAMHTRSDQFDDLLD